MAFYIMKKKRVLWVLALLLVFAGLLMMLQIQRYGSIAGFVSYIPDKTYLAEKAIHYDQVFIYARFFIISVFSIFAVEYLYKFHMRLNTKPEKPFESKFIDLDFKN